MANFLPLGENPFLKDNSYSYFTNLLPEGKILTVLSRKLQIPVSNQFELLEVVGGDCAGAVSLFQEGILPLLKEINEVIHNLSTEKLTVFSRIKLKPKSIEKK